jgi:outer membrane protein W
MKKAFLSMMVLAALTSTKSNAQVKDNLSLGPIGGFGHSTISGDIGTGTKRKFEPSLNVGGRLVYSATPKLGFGLDATFRTEGGKFESSALENRVNLNYVRLDPKLLYFFGDYGQALRPKIGVGPSFGFLVGGKDVTKNGSTVVEEIDSKDAYKGFDFGLSALLGFNYRIKNKTWLNVDASYNHGLTDVLKANNTDNSLQNRSIFLNVGVTFGIGHAEVK